MTLEWLGCRSRNQYGDGEPWMLHVPVHIVTNSTHLLVAFIQLNVDQSLVIGFDYEGVDLAWYGCLCIMQVCSLPTSVPNALCIWGVSLVSMFSQSVFKFVVCDVICNSSWSFQFLIWYDLVGKQVHPNSNQFINFHKWQLAFDNVVYLVDTMEGGDALMQACKLALESLHVTKVCHDYKCDSEVPFTSCQHSPLPIIQCLICICDAWYWHFHSK